MTQLDLEALLQSARQFNASQDVTGVLLHHTGSFWQYLEGPRQGIERVYTRIRGSHLHTDLFELLDGPADERLFPDWKMGSTGVPESTMLSLRSASWHSLGNAKGDLPALSPGMLLLRAHFGFLTSVS
jgi:hypothetical protein